MCCAGATLTDLNKVLYVQKVHIIRLLVLNLAFGFTFEQLLVVFRVPANA